MRASRPLMPLFLLLIVNCMSSSWGYEIEFLRNGDELIVDVRFKGDDPALSLPIQISPEFEPTVAVLEPTHPQGDLVTITPIGYMGDARVAILTIRPTGGRIKLKVKTGVFQSGSSPQPERPFDAFLNSLLPNYTPLSTSRLYPAPASKTWTPPKPACKIYVDKDGIYHLSYSELRSAGVPLRGVDPRSFRMFNRGKPIPLFVAGESDGRFDPGDYIEFWGEPNRDDYTDLNVYWLTWGLGRGERMALKDAGTSVDKIADRCRVTEHFEVDAFRGGLGYISDLESFFFWRSITPVKSKRVRFDLYGVQFPDEVKFRALFYGRSLTQHHLLLYLNGAPIGDMRWSGQSRATAEAIIPAGVIRNGANFLVMRCPGDTESGEVEQVILDWIEVEYTKRLIAHEDMLFFESPMIKDDVTFRLSGFSQKSVEVYRDGWVKFVNLKFEKDELGYSVRFTDVPAGARYIALTPDHKLKPRRIELDEPSTLRNPSNSADYLIIVYDAFINALKRFVQHRSKRLKVFVAKTSDIYDEFNYGILSPRAIRDFLRYTYFHWRRPAPSYVLLMGDSTWNKRQVNFVPTYYFNSFKFGPAATDNLLACVSGDDPLPDMFIGRIPARTPREVEEITGKIIRQEREMSLGDWRRRLVFVAAPGWFESSSEKLIFDFVPPSYELRRIYTDKGSLHYGTSDDLIRAINEGCALVHFTGHGGGSIWSDERIFAQEHVQQLHNPTLLPFVVSFTCFTAYFDNPGFRGLGEELLMYPDGGAIGVLGSTGLGWIKGDYLLERGFFSALFDHNFRKLGPTVVAAKFLTPSYMLIYDILNLYNLLGDPYSDVPLPKWKIEMEILPTSDGKAVKVVGKLPEVDGEIRLILMGDDGPLDDLRISAENGRFESELRDLPAGVDLSIAAYLQNGVEDAIGAVKFRLANDDEVDLSISSSSINLIEDEGEKFLSIKVDNLGGKSSGPFEVKVWIGDEVQTITVPAVKGRWSTTVRIRLPGISSETKIVVEVDPRNEIKESNEGNNRAEKTLIPSSSNVTSLYGGKVESVDGRVICEFAPGSVPESVVVSIIRRPIYLFDSSQPSLQPVSDAYEIKSDIPIHDTRFRISFKAEREKGMGIYRWEESPGMWVRALERGFEGEVDELGIYAICLSDDKVPPKISLNVIDRQLEIDGTFCSENPIISITISDENGVQTADLYLDGTPVSPDDYDFSRMERRTEEATLTWEPNLKEGKHMVRVVAYDTSLNSSEATLKLTVGGEMKIKAIANHPNPFSEKTWIAYLLTQGGDEVEIKIFSTSGRLLRRLKYLPARAGYNEVSWDGRDEDGNPVSNGVYFYKVIVRSGDKTVSKTGKMVIWRGG